MDDLELFPVLPSRKTMTVKEVAEALGVHTDTVNSWVKKLYPELPRNGVPTVLDEAQVTSVKINIESSGRNDLRNIAQLQNIHTDLEMKQKAAEVIGWLYAEADRLRGELALSVAARALDAPKVACAEALMRSEKNMSVTDAAKHFGLHPRTEVFPYLRALGYLTRDDLPTQKAIDAGYLALRVTVDHNSETHSQAVVETWQLENWRAHVVHQIKRWVHEENRP